MVMAFWIRVAVVLAVSLSPVVMGAAERDTRKDDLANRDQAIHWPKEFDPVAAPAFSHNELLIHADCHRVWTQLVNVVEWPDWFVLTKEVTIDEGSKTIQHGTVLRLKIFGSPITSVIDEFIPYSRLSWIPKGLDETRPSHYHTWHLIPEPSGCLVVTEESGIGPNDIKDPRHVSWVMHQAHELWLASLKWKTEQ
jgi:hypothetical protein